MRKMFLRALSLTLALAMALSLAACGGAASTPASEAPAASEAAPAESAAPAEPTGGRPEGYPEKDITYIFPFSAGGTNDVWLRLLAEKVKQDEGWEHSIVVDYQEGASGDVGWSAIAAAEPDGYTIGFCPTAMLISSIGLNRGYGTDKIDYIASMMIDPGVIGVASNSKYNTLTELVDEAIANPNKVSIGVTAVTASEGLALTQLQRASGAQFNIIPFDGETAVLTAVAGGHCDAFCLNVSDGKTFVDEGSIKYLATGAEERSKFYPDIPTYQESGYDVIQSNCRAIGCPEGTDPAIIQYLSDCFMAAATSPEIVAKGEEMMVPAVSMPTEEVTQFFADMDAAYHELWNTEPWQ